MYALRVKAVAAKCGGVGVATVWRWVKNNGFPTPFSLGSGVTVWDEADIDRWLEQRKGEKSEGR